jgi:hypothetical protein
MKNSLPVAIAALLILGCDAGSDHVTAPVIPARLILSMPPVASPQSRIPFAIQPVVQLHGVNGQPVATAGVPVTASISTGGGTLGGIVLVTTASNGAAAFTNLSIAGTVGLRTLTFSAPGLENATATVTLTAGVPSATATAGGNNQSAVAGASVALAPSVKVSDADDNPVSGAAVTFSVAAGGGNLTGANQTTNTAGIATVGSWTLGTTGGVNRIVATSTGLPGSPITFTATSTVSNGENYSGTVSAPGAHDTVPFSATQGEAIVLSIGKVSTSTLWPWIRLVSPSGAIIRESLGFSAAQITVTAPSSGAYSVIVGSNNGFGSYVGTGDYVLSLVKVPGAVVVSAGDDGGAMSNGASHAGNITMGDVDPWSFTANQGNLIVLSIGEVSSTSTLWPWIRLMSPTGAIIGEHWGYSVAQINLTAPSSGTYSVIVGSNDGSGIYSGTGNYMLTLVKVPGSLLTLVGDEGGVMFDGVSYDGNITMGDLDPWFFTANQGDAIVLSMREVSTSSTLWPWIRLISATGEIIGENWSPSAAQINVTAPAAGGYRVIVGSYDGFGSYVGTGNYILTGTAVPGLTVTTASPLATGTQGTAYSTTLAATGGTGSFAWAMTSGALPAGLSLGASTGTISGTPTENGTFTFTVRATSGSQSASKTFSLVIAPAGVTVTTASPLAAGTQGTSYSTTLAATGGTGSFAWAVTSGALPAGLSLGASTATISGTPTENGNFTFTVRATSGGQSGSKTFSLTIAPPGVTVTTASPLAAGTIGKSYSTTLAATGGTGSYAWAVTSGSLPGGLSLGAGTGTISGTPTANGTFTFTVRATSGGQSGSKTFSLTIAAATQTPASISVTPASPTIQVPCTLQLSAVVRDAQGNVLSTPVQWTSAASAIASVSSSGLVTGKSPGGPVAITASAGGITGAASITVIPALPTPGPTCP